MATPVEKAFKCGLAIGMSLPARSVADISREVEVSERTVFRWIVDYRRIGKTAAAKSPGRPKKTTPRSNRLLCKIALNNHLHSSSQLRQQWQERVSLSIVYRRLRSLGIRRRRAIVPFLSPANVANRLQWSMARAH